MSEFLDEWLPAYSARRRLSEATALGYAGLIKNHVTPVIGNVQVNQLDPHHVAMIFEVANDLSSSTRGQIHTVLQRALDDAENAGLVARNPCRSLERPRRGRRVEQRALEEAEVARLVHATLGTPYQAVVAFAIATGMRRGELLALRWADVDLEGRAVTVRRSARSLAGKGMVVSPTKTASSMRTIEISATTVDALRRHRARQGAARLRVGPAWRDHDLVFPSSVGTHWIDGNFNRGFRELVNHAEFSSPGTIRFHSLRHTAASLWIARGIDAYTISRRLGHASASFTYDTYGHLMRGQQKGAAEALDDLLSVR